MFVNLFLPKKAPKDLIGDLVNATAEKYAMFKLRRIAKRREKEFEKNRKYSGKSELNNIEVFTTKEETNNEKSED
jgi:hypothetical protein